ncbi:MAG: hypothetical protein MJ252_10360, partial [archaeon]|nr:hypothetical protein [archaeon]
NIKILLRKIFNFEQYSFTKLFYMYLTQDVKKADLIYEIEGKNISIFDLKEILINGNFIKYLGLKFENGDFDENNFNENHFLYDKETIKTKSELQFKLRTLILDPILKFNYETRLFIPFVSHFESKGLVKAINKHYEDFIKEKIILDTVSLRYPSIFHEYLPNFKDFNNDGNKMQLYINDEKKMQLYILESLYNLDDKNENLKMLMKYLLEGIVKVIYYDLNES